ncbi:hypothetical protein PVAND_015468 [Polypedilum vanderplanki]|uniref:Uncharacterized protein n=1 Tax=Polypedilum vanderplanki TaxID=319348 RepID=A0A9J6BD34_POLVA|nr:hypothetical protein PVAND_015468 [Polypedilum vanderplanki]
MYYLPRGFKRYFIEIKRLEIKESHLKELSRDDLAQFPELWDLSVPYNDITTIESDLLDMNPKIQHLNLRHNRITFIAEKIEKMTNLELILDDNFINQTVYKQKHEINETKHETTEVSDYSTIILSIVLAISIMMNAFLIITLWLRSKQQNIEPRKMTKKFSNFF